MFSLCRDFKLPVSQKRRGIARLGHLVEEVGCHSSFIRTRRGIWHIPERLRGRQFSISPPWRLRPESCQLCWVGGGPESYCMKPSATALKPTSIERRPQPFRASSANV